MKKLFSRFTHVIVHGNDYVNFTFVKLKYRRFHGKSQKLIPL